MLVAGKKMVEKFKEENGKGAGKMIMKSIKQKILAFELAAELQLAAITSMKKQNFLLGRKFCVVTNKIPFCLLNTANKHFTNKEIKQLKCR